MIGIAICSHNPDDRLLARVLQAVSAQTVPPDECVIVDNNSDPPLATRDAVRAFLQKFPRARVINEPRQGLTFARVTAIEETTAPVLCFVDDDNEPAHDYLQNAAAALRANASIGALGAGKIAVDFVDDVPEWFRTAFSFHFQARDSEGLTYGCVSAAWTDYYPNGSCLLVRREVLATYREAVRSGRLSATDRIGRRLTSGGDTQIVWEAVKMGLAAGVSGELRLTHMIPAKRATLPYMKRLLFGTASSYLPVLVDSFPDEESKLPHPPNNGQIAVRMLRIATGDLLRGRWKMLPLDLAAYAGRTAGLIRATGAGERRVLNEVVRLLDLE